MSLFESQLAPEVMLYGVLLPRVELEQKHQSLQLSSDQLGASVKEYREFALNLATTVRSMETVCNFQNTHAVC